MAVLAAVLVLQPVSIVRAFEKSDVDKMLSYYKKGSIKKAKQYNKKLSKKEKAAYRKV